MLKKRIITAVLCISAFSALSAIEGPEIGIELTNTVEMEFADDPDGYMDVNETKLEMTYKAFAGFQFDSLSLIPWIGGEYEYTYSATDPSDHILYGYVGLNTAYMFTEPLTVFLNNEFCINSEIENSMVKVWTQEIGIQGAWNNLEYKVSFADEITYQTIDAGFELTSYGFVSYSYPLIGFELEYERTDDLEEINYGNDDTSKNEASLITVVYLNGFEPYIGGIYIYSSENTPDGRETVDSYIGIRMGASIGNDTWKITLDYHAGSDMEQDRLECFLATSLTVTF
jgi:hypothetical protein